MTSLPDIISRLDAAQPVAVRMRAIFGLKGLNTLDAIRALENSLRTDPSALVRHEVAYVLGQMGAHAAIPTLRATLSNDKEDVMVRHEAGEALGAIGNPDVLPLLQQYAVDNTVSREIRETCVIAVDKIQHMQPSVDGAAQGGDCTTTGCTYTSVDPAPPSDANGTRDVSELRDILCDGARTLYERYGALFSLRNRGGAGAVNALCDGMELERDSALFRHEVAYVLGQMASPVSVPALARVLRRDGESAMVRHEAAEALGAVGNPHAEAVLREFREDKADVVRESVEVALDISDYVASDTMHYADTLGIKSQDVESQKSVVLVGDSP